MNMRATLLLFIVSIQPAFAIQIDSLSMFMNETENMIGQKISNPGSTAHMVTISVEEIDSPYTMKPLAVSAQNKGDIRFTPERILMPAGASNFVKFYYHGKSDDKERYYRVTWLDDPLAENGKNSNNRSATMHAVASVGTVLVVQPRIAHVAYKYNNGQLINTGNTSFRIVAYGPCRHKNTKEKLCQQSGPVAPGIAYSLSKIDLTSPDAHLGIWKKDRLIPVELVGA